MKYDAIIIGAGLGGLTAGAKLSSKGKRVLVLEQHAIPGGCATNFNRKNFTFEVGLHELDGLDEKDLKTKIFSELGVFDKLEFIPLPEFFRFTNGKIDIVIPDNKNKAIEVLADYFPNQKRGIDKYFKVIFGIIDDLHRLPKNKFLMFCSMPVFPIRFPYLTKYMNSNLGDFLDETFTDEDIKLVLAANLGYYHDRPYSMSLLYYSAGQASFFNGGYYIKGGSQKLSDYLAGYILDHGGAVKYKRIAEKIIIENGKAVGVQYSGKSRFNKDTFSDYADAIVANNAVPNIPGMLPEKEALKLNSKISGLRNSCSVSSLYLGFGSPPKNSTNHHYSTIIGDPGVKNLEQLGDNLRLADFEKRQIIFVDYSQIDSGLTSNDKAVGAIAFTDYAENWENLSGEEYKEKKEKVSGILIERLEKVLPGIKEQIEYYELSTPKTVEKFTLNPGGAVYGFAQIPEQAGIRRLKGKSPIKNLYFASAWTFPGGGFTGAIMSGCECAESILEE